MSDQQAAVRRALLNALESLYLDHHLGTSLDKGAVPVSSYVNSRTEECGYNVVTLAKSRMSIAELKAAYAVDTALPGSQEFKHSVIDQARADAEGQLVALHAEHLPLPPGFTHGGPLLEKRSARYCLIIRGRKNELAAVGTFGFDVTTGQGEQGSKEAAALAPLDALLRVNLHVSFDYVYTFKAHRGKGAASALVLVAYEAYLLELAHLAAQLRPTFESTGLEFKLTTSVYCDIKSQSGMVLTANLLTLMEGARELAQEGDPLFSGVELQEVRDESAFVSLF